MRGCAGNTTWFKKGVFIRCHISCCDLIFVSSFLAIQQVCHSIEPHLTECWQKIFCPNDGEVATMQGVVIVAALAIVGVENFLPQLISTGRKFSAQLGQKIFCPYRILRVGMDLNSPQWRDSETMNANTFTPPTGTDFFVGYKIYWGRKFSTPTN